MENPVIVSVLLNDGVDQNTFVSSFDSVYVDGIEGYVTGSEISSRVSALKTDE